MSQTIRRTKFRIKDVIDSNLYNQDQHTYNKMWMTLILQNKLWKIANQLLQNLHFNSKNLQKIEIWVQFLLDYVKIRMLDLCQLVNQYYKNKLLLPIPKSQIHTYLLQAQQDRPKRVLKRFAHWEWDKDQGCDKNMMNYQFTQRNEAEIKSKLKNKDGEISLRKRILQKWSKHLPSLTGLNEFGKQFTMDHSSLKKTLSLSPTPRQESYHQISNWLQELEELKLDNERVKKKLERTLQSLHRK